LQSHLTSTGAFDPEAVRILTGAFEAACRTLDLDGSPAKHKTRNKLARLIIALGYTDERDMAKLRDDAVAFMRLSSG